MDDGDALAAAVRETPQDTTLNLVFADYVESQGWVESARYVRHHGCDSSGVGVGGVGVGGVGGVGGDGGDGGDGGVGGVGVGGVGGDGGVGGVGVVGGVGDGGGVGVVGDGGGGVGDGGDGDGGVGRRVVYPEVCLVKDGFYILVIRGGYYPYVLAGWVFRRDYLLLVQNSRIIKRFGTEGQLSKLAKSGPLKTTQLLDVSPEEYVPLSSVSRIIPADPMAWGELCPKPSGE